MEGKLFNDGKPGPGRPKGSRNKSKIEASDLAQRLLNREYRKSLKARLLRGEVPPQVEIMLWCYAFGKPLDKPALPPPEDNPAPQQASTDSYKQVRELIGSLIKAEILPGDTLARLAPSENGTAS